jgi:hypothetical protein
VEDAISNTADVPLPTPNGGYTHTSTSKAKISAANKGKTPWNKGRKRSPEERARIAAGVRAKNRQRFLEKLASMNMTEAEWEEQEAEKKRIKAEQIAERRTENGGFRPTEETRKKISRILKEKHARGEVKRTPRDPSMIRRGFQHSEETRRKISESLRKRWATDEEYRKNMRERSQEANKSSETRQRISETLRQKWQDPEFRSRMMNKIGSRSSPGRTRDESHKERISEAMKLKWQDEEYRKKTLEAIARKRKEQSRTQFPQKEKEASRSKTERASSRVVVKKVMPVKVTSNVKTSNSIATTIPLKKSVARHASKLKGQTAEFVPIQPLQTGGPKKAKKKKRVVTKKKNSTEDAPSVSANGESQPPKEKDLANGSVSRLREERRDLYDLLYGDEDDSSRLPVSAGNPFTSILGDENLDTFDPYGLDDF